MECVYLCSLWPQHVFLIYQILCLEADSKISARSHVEVRTIFF